MLSWHVPVPSDDRVKVARGNTRDELRVRMCARVFCVEAVHVGHVDEGRFEVARDFCCGAVARAVFFEA